MASKTRQALASPDIQFGDPKLDRLVQHVSALTKELQKVQQMVAGGSVDQVLVKNGSADYEAAWGASASGGTVTGAKNLGAGSGLFVSLSGTLLQFKGLLAGANIVLESTGDTIQIAVTGLPPDGVGTVTSVGINSADLIVSGSPVTGSGSIELEIAPQAVTYPKIQFTASDAVMLGRGFGEGVGPLEELTLSQVLDLLGSAQQGDILFRGAVGWQYLPPGTPGLFLQTQGPAADVQWQATGTATTLLDPLIIGLDYDLVSSVGWANTTIACLLRAALLSNLATSWNFGLNVSLGPMLVTSCVVRRVLRDTNTYIDSTAVTFGGSLTPTLVTGLNVSDEIALPIDDAHDYVILLHFDAGVSGTASLPLSAGDGSDLASTSASGDHTTDTDFSAFTFTVDNNLSFYGAWVVGGNIGSITAVWRSGSGAPSNSLGVDGDFYLDSLTGDVYEKAGGSYSIVANIEGPAGTNGTNGTNGAPGSVWRDGTGVPSNSLGINGDYYLDDGTNFVYAKSGGVYAHVATLGGGSSSPLTTKGDLFGHSTVDARVAVSATDLQFLAADSTTALGVSYQFPSLFYGGPDLVTPPGVGWTWLAQGSNTVASVYGGRALRFTVVGVSNDSLYVNTVTPGTFTATACLMISGFNIATFSRVGLYWRDSSTGHMQLFIVDMRTSPIPMAQYTFSNLTTFNSTIFSGITPTQPRPFVSVPIWMRVTRDGSNNIRCFFSDDGVDFNQVGTTDAGNYVSSPDQIGIGFENTSAPSASTNMTVTVYSFAIGP